MYDLIWIKCNLVWINNNLGTLIVGLAASLFAWYQYKINKRQYLLSKSQLYIDNSVQLLELINKISSLDVSSFIRDAVVIKEICSKVDKIYFTAQLYLSKDIVEYIEPLLDSLRLISYYNENYFYYSSVIDKLNLDNTLSINLRVEVFMGDGKAYYRNGDEVVQHGNIQGLHSRCEQQIKLASETVGKLKAKFSFTGDYAPYKICEKYKKYTVVK